MRIECRVLRHSLERTESYIVIRRRVPEGPILLFPELRFNFYQAIVFLVLAKVGGVFFRAQLQSVYFSLYSNLIQCTDIQRLQNWQIKLPQNLCT